jgi:uncharacterized protein (DUF2252 family)
MQPVTRKEARYLLFRMACPLMQAKLQRFVDLRDVPSTFIHGNPHIDNYVRTFKGSAMMDFDRSRIGPYCWDIIRFLSSLSLRREEMDGFLDHRVVENFIDSYVTHFLHPEIPSKQLKLLKNVEPERWQLSTRDYLRANKKWAKKMREHLISADNKAANEVLRKFLESRKELGLLSTYAVSEIGYTPGSLGKKHFIYSLVPRKADSHLDMILLDIKEVYDERDTKFFYSPVHHHGLRMIQASTLYADGMEERLGYCTVGNKQYWGRQIPSFAVKVKKFLNREEQCDFAYSVASELGKGHRKGLKNQERGGPIMKDFQLNFDKYLKISKLFTYELSLAFDTIERKTRLYRNFRSW